MSRASRFLAPHTFSFPTLHTSPFLTISRTPRFLVPHVSSRLELSREERLLLRTGIMQNFCSFSTKNDVSIPRNVDLKYNIFQNWLLSLWSPERFRNNVPRTLRTLQTCAKQYRPQNWEAVQSSNLFHALLRAFSAGWYLNEKHRRF